jgi:hypothetical protein
LLAGNPNVKVMFENLTLLAPKTQIVSGEVFPNGGGPPLPVMYAGPLTTNPPLTGGLKVGQLAAQSSETVPSITMWCVCAPRVAGDGTQPQDVSIYAAPTAPK